MNPLRKRLAICFAALLPLTALSAQIYGSGEGDAAVAAKYTAWAESAIAEGRWSEAHMVLERGADFAAVSSDLSYLLALTRTRFGKPRGSILVALRIALYVNRWTRYTPDQARLLEAETLITIKFFERALSVLSHVNESPQKAKLTLSALRFLRPRQTFLRYAAEVFDRYPRETEPVRIFLDYLRLEKVRGDLPDSAERELLDLIVTRLPVLLPADEELGWMAAPFLRDAADAVRHVSAYRAVNEPVPESLPAALELGVIDEFTAVDELFAAQKKAAKLDLSLIETIWDLLRTDEARDLLGENLSFYTGTLTGDSNGDGLAEAETEYANGVPEVFSHDENQDGLPELVVNFAGGVPVGALVSAASDSRPDFWNEPAARDESRPDTITVRWERYPSAGEVLWGDERFIPRPLSLNFAPVQFAELPWSTSAAGPFAAGLLVPRVDPFAASLTRQTLAAYSLRVERPSVEFAGAVETVELNMSIPVSAREYLDGRLVSQTEFLRGRPQIQRVDLDLDGRLETTRFFRRFSLAGEDGTLAPVETLLDYPRDFERAESDWTGDGTVEIYSEDW